MRCDFIEDRYATDCGPICRKCDNGMQGMYVYLNTGESWFGERAWVFAGQCATCHHLFEFPVPFTDGAPTIHQVKDAHFDHPTRMRHQAKEG